MAKKKFIDDFDSLFDGIGEDHFPPEPQVNIAVQKTEKPEQDTTRSSGKNFASDLQSFLEDAFEETLTEQLAEMPKKKTPSFKKRRRPALGGLDMLIRNTVSMDQVDMDPGKATRRVTLVFEQEKLEKLRSIAESEKTYLKDVIASIVEEYLERHELKQ